MVASFFTFFGKLHTHPIGLEPMSSTLLVLIRGGAAIGITAVFSREVNKLSTNV